MALCHDSRMYLILKKITIINKYQLRDSVSVLKASVTNIPCVVILRDGHQPEK